MAKITTTKGKPQLILDGYLYNVFRRSEEDGSIRWRCKNRCGGWVTEVEEKFEGHVDHGENCLPSATRIEVATISSEMKNRAKSNPYEKPASIVKEVLKTTSENVRAHLPKDPSLKANISYHRVKGHHKNSTKNLTRTELEIPPEYAVTCRNEQFVLADTGSEDRIIVFATKRNLQVLAQCQVWLCDGTFKTCPRQFYQVFSIHGVKEDGWTFPLVIALLPGKRQAVYERLLEILKEHQPDDFGFFPEIIICDFETAMLNALTKTFPNAQIQGCLFHFAQACERNLDAALKRELANSHDLEVHVKKFQALAFVPPFRVQEVFDQLKTVASKKYPIMETFINYFEKVWIGTKTRGPEFKPELWNVYQRVLANVPRTNNSVEGWHNALSNRCPGSHPGFYLFLELIQSEQSHTENRLVQRNAGEQRPLKERRYAELDQRIVRLVRTAEKQCTDWLEYLRGVGNCMMKIRVVKKRKPRQKLPQSPSKRPCSSQSTSATTVPSSQVTVTMDSDSSDSDFEAQPHQLQTQSI